MGQKIRMSYISIGKMIGLAVMGQKLVNLGHKNHSAVSATKILIKLRYSFSYGLAIAAKFACTNYTNAWVFAVVDC